MLRKLIMTRKVLLEVILIVHVLEVLTLAVFGLMYVLLHVPHP